MIRRTRRDGREARGNEGRRERIEKGSREGIEKETKRQFEEKKGLRDPPLYIRPCVVAIVSSSPQVGAQASKFVFTSL